MYLTKQYNPRIKNQTDKLFKNFIEGAEKGDLV